MRHIHHLIDGQKFKFVSDMGEIGHYEIIDSKLINKNGHQGVLI